MACGKPPRKSRRRWRTRRRPRPTTASGKRRATPERQTQAIRLPVRKAADCQRRGRRFAATWYWIILAVARTLCSNLWSEGLKEGDGAAGQADAEPQGQRKTCRELAPTGGLFRPGHPPLKCEG